MQIWGEDKRARSWELRHGAGRAGNFFACRGSCAWVGAGVAVWGVVRGVSGSGRPVANSKRSNERRK